LLLPEKYEAQKLQNPAIIVDTKHANSAKRFYEQPELPGKFI
jgi:3-deoxy-D-arabino-heptulosonate 7-phosphate (DAHP) synthase